MIDENMVNDRGWKSGGSSPPRAMHGGTLLGIFVGLVLGLAVAATIAFLLGRSGLSGAPAATGAAKEITRNGKPDPVPTTSMPDKPRFDFYKILPGAEEPKLAKAPETHTRVADRLWLQAGAFASETDAENLKARLALSGWEASVQTATLPDKSVRYRVRLGPYDNADELNRIKADLGKGGFDAAVIKNP